jgi:hypothetical protein
MLIILFILLISPSIAHGYIDPGSGSYFIQVVAALLFGSLYTVKHYWQKIGQLVRNLLSKKTKS